MLNKTIDQENRNITQFISNKVGGVDLETILKKFGSAIPRRTLQRRLSMLVTRGQLYTQGAGRAVKYYATSAVVTASTQIPQLAAISDSSIMLSQEGQAIQIHVRQAKQLRQPVGYQREWVEQYSPNKTYYLPQSLRQQLFDLGRPANFATPAGTFARDILNRLLIDLSWASSSLEGNTYSRLDTERLIEFGQAAEGKDAFEAQMILNHKAAIEYLVLDHKNANVANNNTDCFACFVIRWPDA